MPRRWIIVFGVTVLAIAAAVLLWAGSRVRQPVQVVQVSTAPPPPVAPPPQTNEVQVAPVVAEVAPREAPSQVEVDQPGPREQRNETVRLLQTVEAQLATGNTDGVDAILQTSAESLDEPARGMLTAAHESLENNDLTMTRENLRRAIAAAVR